MLQPQPFRSKSGEVLYRRTRCDQRCFVDCVASYPVETERVKRASNIEKQTLNTWLHKTHHFIQSQFGAHHIASCLHLDESHPHLHFYIVGNASRLHPGLRAEFYGRQRIKDDKERARRHRAGLKAFLDLYYSESVRRLTTPAGTTATVRVEFPNERISKNGNSCLSGVRSQSKPSCGVIRWYGTGPNEVVL